MILLIDKPQWRTSFDVVKKIRNKESWKKKVWHSWTLDPMATWLLVLWTDKDTKLLESIQKLDKDYIANIDFSVFTDTWDMDYHNEIINYDTKIMDWKFFLQKEWLSILSPDIFDIKNKLDLLIPEYELPLPAFSAKKIKWKKSYDLARKWNILKRSQNMKMFNYEIIDYNFPNLKIKFTVWSGCYIRSIAYWIWKEFNLWWTLSYLRRTRIGDYDIKYANTIL